jgi:hypothetical protein
MKLSHFRATVRVGILCGCLVPAAGLLAQAPAGPLPPSHPLPPPPPAPPAEKKPEVAARKTLAGFWRLNSDQSDDPRQKFADARKTQGGQNGPMGNPGGGMGGPRIGMGYPYPGGGPNGPYGGPGAGGRSGNDESYDQMEDQVRPATSQEVTLRDAEVDSSDEHRNLLIFYTDGRKVQKSNDDSRQEVSARWNGPQLVTDEAGPQKRKMSRTLELSPDGKQMVETWRIDGRRANSQQIVIRYVYDAAVEYDR